MPSPRHRRALVTGAGRRVGAAIARSLAAAGMDVAVHYHGSAAGAQQTCRDIEAVGGRGIALQADLGDLSAARGLIDRAVEALAGLDLLVASAANYERVPLQAIDDGHVARALGLNLQAPLVMAQRAAPTLSLSRGNIVFITCNSRLAPYRDYLPYQVSKAGLFQAMRLLALELAPAVRVNAVAPGTVLPPDGMSADELRGLVDRIPLGHVGEAADVAEAVRYLAFADAVTGQELVVDGGRAVA